MKYVGVSRVTEHENIRINCGQNKKQKVCEENKLVKQKKIFDQI